MTGLFVAVAVIALGGAGAVARWQLAVVANGTFPTGTLAANVMGSFALALLVNSGEALLTAVGIGLLGSFTTFSTVMAETSALASSGRHRAGVSYLLATVVGSVGAALIGLALVL